VVEKAALQRELVSAVLELDEPYRTTILLRFFEDLPQREIARRMQTTSATVNSRITRALARLRARMSRGRGGTAWLQVLVPLLRESTTAPAVALGAGAMKIVLTSVVVAASVLAGLVLWNAQGAAPPVDGARAPAPATAAAELTGSTPAPPSVETAEVPREARTPLAVEASPARVAPEPAAPAARVVRGRVLDASGAAVSGLELALSAKDSHARCTSDAAGWFEIALDAPAEAIVSADPRYTTVLAGSARVHAATEPLVVVAPRIEVAGTVVDEFGTPLADAALELCLPAGFGAEWGLALDYSLPQRWRASSAADGRFELAAIPALAGATIRAALAGFAPRADEAPARSTRALEIVLARPGEAAGLVRGVVLDAAGARAEGARVSAGAEIALTDARGEFTLDVRTAGTRARLVALKRGLLPAVFEPETDARGAPLWPADVVLRLGARAHALAGRVVDDDGEPVAGAQVWLDDPTPFGVGADARLVAENVLRGDERFWSFERTGADGTFSIDGLLARAYRLQVIDPRTLASFESAPVTAADSPVELRLPTHDVHARVAGRVVSAAGQPIAGVNVRLYRVTYELVHESGTDNEGAQSEPVVTDADGAFEFRDVPRGDVDVLASGDTILGAGAVLAEEADVEHVEIVASLRLHLQVELDEPRDRADRLRVFDAGGRRVLLSVFHGGGAHADFEMPILEGRSDVLAVGERAATLVLYRGEEEVARLLLQLEPGRTNVVRW
jgi:protocatechuate 3,4-dioxygenase beta subunit